MSTTESYMICDFTNDVFRVFCVVELHLTTGFTFIRFVNFFELYLGGGCEFGVAEAACLSTTDG